MASLIRHVGILQFATVAGLAALPGCRNRPGFGEVEFAVPVGRLPVSMRSEMAAGLATTDTVRLRLPGQVFTPARPARIISRDSIDRTTLLGASDADFSAFKAEDDGWIAETFASGEDDEVARLLTDSVIRTGSRSMFRDIARQDVYAIAEFRTDSAFYGFVFLRYEPAVGRPTVQTYLLEGGEWHRTNAIVRNPTVRFLNVAFRLGTLRPAP